MKKKYRILLLVLVLVLLLVLLGLLILRPAKNVETEQPAIDIPSTFQLSNDIVSLDFEYKEDTYFYSGTVQKPTPCDVVDVESLIFETFPEKVKMDITIEKSDAVCIQVIDEEEISGEFKVDKAATIRVFLDGEEVE